MAREKQLRVLMVTSEWPTTEHPEWVPFLVQRANYLRRAGVDIEVFHFRGSQNPINYLQAWRKLRSHYVLDDFDVIDVQFGQSGLVALPSPTPLVVTFHGSDLQGFVGKNGRPTIAGKILRQASRYVARCAAAIIVVSAHLREYLPGGCSGSLVPCGVDFDLFRPLPQEEAREQLGLPAKIPLVLFAANPVNPIKRYTLAQSAVSRLSADLNAQLVTVSNVAHEKMPLYMNACDTLLLTSKHEGSPTVVKEALACNLPVVATDVGDVEQRLGSVDGCIVCADDREETVATGLARVLRRRERIAGRAAAGDLDEKKLVQKVIGIYNSAITRS